MFTPVRLASLAAALLLTAASLPSAVPTVGAADVTVSMKNLDFAPTQITVAAGDTVVWVNDDLGLPHDVVSGFPARGDEGELFQSPMLFDGESFSYTFAEPGTYDYFCSIHPMMLAQVTVEGSAFVPAVPDQALVTEESGG